jgi:hypothetical protein
MKPILIGVESPEEALGLESELVELPQAARARTPMAAAAARRLLFISDPFVECLGL